MSDKIKTPLMENAENYIKTTESAHQENFTTGNIIRILTSQMIDNQAAKHFVGIQPMTGPVGLVYSLKYQVQEESSPADMNKNESAPKQISLNVISHTVEAGSRKLEGHATIELIQDATAGSYDIEGEDLGKNFAKEIYEEIRNDISTVAHKEVFNVNEIINDSEHINQSTVNVCINKCANEIARRTRRGAGNFAIVSETLSEILQKNKNFTKTSETDKDYGYVKYLGILNGTIKIYCDYGLEQEKAIVGYKGSGETDTGYFYCPYVPLMTKGVVVDPKTFEPIFTFMTRHGKFINQPTEETTTIDDSGSTTITTKEPCNYYVEATFNGLPELNKLKFEKKETDIKETAIDALDSISDTFEAAMKILD